MTQPLKTYLHERQILVDRALDRYLPAASVPPTVIHKAMRYSIFAGGKRLRPILCLMSAELCGGKTAMVMPTACALEMIHTYSLIHDDLPAMDDDDLRRGKPTNHKVFGEGIAVLAGDALLTLAFELMARVPSGVSADSALRSIRLISEAAGSQGMIGGQAADLMAEGKTAHLSPNRLKSTVDYIHLHKTAALLRASLLAGAVLSGASAAEQKSLDVYGRNIGLAFQIADDILDIVGDKKLLGKKGSDRENQKLTYPAVWGIDRSRRMADRLIREAQEALRRFGKKANPAIELADYVVRREK